MAATETSRNYFSILDEGDTDHGRRSSVDSAVRHPSESQRRCYTRVRRVPSRPPPSLACARMCSVAAARLCRRCAVSPTPVGSALPVWCKAAANRRPPRYQSGSTRDGSTML
jgi:hypothetical protein